MSLHAMLRQARRAAEERCAALEQRLALEAGKCQALKDQVEKLENALRAVRAPCVCAGCALYLACGGLLYFSTYLYCVSRETN